MRTAAPHLIARPSAAREVRRGSPQALLVTPQSLEAFYIVLVLGWNILSYHLAQIYLALMPEQFAIVKKCFLESVSNAHLLSIKCNS